MAFRSSASASSSSGGNLTATPTGVAAHDYLAGWFVSDIAGQAPTQPSGWNALTNVDLSGPDGQTCRFSDKDDASGSDSFLFTNSFGSHCALVTGAWIGRDNSSPRSATPVSTQNTSSNASPISGSISGITASQGDDIAVFVATDQTAGGGRWTGSTITNYTERNDGVAIDWASGIALQTRDNVSSGATGSLSITLTDASAGNAGYAAIVVAIKAAPGGPTINTQPVNQTGSVGGTATYTISATASGGSLSYQWKLNGTNVGTDSSSYTTATLAAGDNGGVVTCVVTDSNGSATSGDRYLFIRDILTGKGRRFNAWVSGK